MTLVAEHHEHRPGPPLAQLVERAVGYRLDGYPPGVHVGMPSSSVTLVIPLDEPLTLTDPGSAAPTRFDAVLAGLATRPTHIHHDGHQYGIQLALTPLAVRVLFGYRAGEMAQGSQELADVMGPVARRLREQLNEIDSWAGRFAAVEKTLLRFEQRRGEVAPEVREAWRLIVASGGSLPIRVVASKIGWSMRRLQQQFNAEFGLTPKSVARVRRFERSVPLVSSGRMPLTDVALWCGWADQAHLTRDWHEFAGSSPTRWRAEDALANL